MILNVFFWRYGFRIPPHLELKARPKLGEREVTLFHVTDWIEKKLYQEFQVVLYKVTFKSTHSTNWPSRIVKRKMHKCFTLQLLMYCKFIPEIIHKLLLVCFLKPLGHSNYNWFSHTPDKTHKMFTKTVLFSVLFQKILVMPNMDDVWLTLMHSAMDHRTAGGPLVSFPGIEKLSWQQPSALAFVYSIV